MTGNEIINNQVESRLENDQLSSESCFYTKRSVSLLVLCESEISMPHQCVTGPTKRPRSYCDWLTCYKESRHATKKPKVLLFVKPHSSVKERGESIQMFLFYGYCNKLTRVYYLHPYGCIMNSV